MGCNDDIFTKFLKSNEKRKTLDKKQTIKVVKQLLESSKYQRHLPACYLKGQKPCSLIKKHEEENLLIDKFNANIDQIIDSILNQELLSH